MKIIAKKEDAVEWDGFIYTIGFEFENGKPEKILASIPLKRISSRMETLSHIRGALLNLVELTEQSLEQFRRF